jgi:hypothetical protein
MIKTVINGVRLSNFLIIQLNIFIITSYHTITYTPS